MGSGVAQYFKVLSPSNVNAFLDYRSMWFLEKVMKKQLVKSPELFRGNAVEQGITKALLNQMSLDDAKLFAFDLFNHEAADLDVDDVKECGEPIPELVRVGYEVLQPYGKVIAVQRKVWVDAGAIPGTVLPWMGYADFIFEGGILVDTKVTGKTPSKMPQGHARQGAFYHKRIPDITRTDFLYLIPLKGGVKHVVHTLENVDAHFENLRQGAISMHKALSFSDNPEDLKHFFYPAPGDWWMAEASTLNVAKEVWEIA